MALLLLAWPHWWAEIAQQCAGQLAVCVRTKNVDDDIPDAAAAIVDLACCTPRAGVCSYADESAATGQWALSCLQ